MHSQVFSTFVEKWVHRDYPPQPVPAESLDRVEARLKTLLPKSYRLFMQSIGPASADLSLLSAIVDQRLNLDDLQEFFASEAVVEQTEIWRKIRLPETLLAFAAQGSGDLFCFEVVPQKSPAPEDAKVWYFNHEEGEASNLEVSFIPWLAQYAAIAKSEA